MPCLTLAVGEASGTNRLMLSENRGIPNSDPYGCIEGRHLAVSQPGLYCLGFRVVDASTNGPGGEPIHAPSPLYRVYLQGGLTVTSLTRQGTAATVLFGGEATRTFYLERSMALGRQLPGKQWPDP